MHQVNISRLRLKRYWSIMIGFNLHHTIASFVNKMLSVSGIKICRSNARVYDPKKYLLVEKNQFILGRREDKSCDIVDDAINDEATYNHLWKSKEFIHSYLDDQRIAFYAFVIEEVLATKNFGDSSSAIDVGCGTGDFLAALHKRCHSIDIVGVDYSASSIDRCRKIVPSGSFRVCDIFKLNSILNHFDLVFCMEVLEHIQYPNKAIENLKSICKSGGLIVITIPNGEVDSWIGHINFWTPKSFAGVLAESGLKLLRFNSFCDYYMIFIAQRD